MRYKTTRVKYDGDIFEVMLDTQCDDQIEDVFPIDSEISILHFFDDATRSWFHKAALNAIREESMPTVNVGDW